jgi:hypothetical protein
MLFFNLSQHSKNKMSVSDDIYLSSFCDILGKSVNYLGNIVLYY